VADLPTLAGRAVAVPLGAIARLRAGKPMHPRGVVADAVLARTGGPGLPEVPWLAGPAEDPATVRLSRGAGLPPGFPDLLGLAVRVPGGDGPVDVLLSSAGRGRLTRQVPAARRDAATTYTSIMGYRSDAGTLRLAAWPAAGTGPLPAEPAALAAALGGAEFVLAVARGAGPWRPFGRLRLLRPVEDVDRDVRYDAVRHPPPGLVPDGPMARFRAPAYATAHRAR
jgi:hypothetical protein